MATLPSPTKKVYSIPTTPQQEPSTSLRGSFAAEASTGNDSKDLIIRKARDARAAVAKGWSRQPSTSSITTNNNNLSRRTLGPTQSEPSFSFYTQPKHEFKTTNEINQSVFGSGGSTGKRFNELKPMYDSNNNSPVRMFNGEFGRSGSYQDDNNDGEGDGFDMDQVYSENSKLNFGKLGGGTSFGRTLSFGTAPIEESQESMSSTTTVTKQLKRAFEESELESTSFNQFENGEAEGDEDFEMETTDIEDEGDGLEEEADQVVNDMENFSMPIGRKIAGRKGLQKSQSLPAHVFNSALF